LEGKSLSKYPFQLWHLRKAIVDAVRAVQQGKNFMNQNPLTQDLEIDTEEYLNRLSQGRKPDLEIGFYNFFKG